MNLEPFLDKFKAFGCTAVEINGHDFSEIRKGFAMNNEGKPKVIIMDTIKGKGVSFMENSLLWHYRFPHDGEEYDNAKEELEKNK